MNFKNGELSRQISNLGVAVDETALNEALQRFPDWTEREKLGFRGRCRSSADIENRLFNGLRTPRQRLEIQVFHVRSNRENAVELRSKQFRQRQRQGLIFVG